MTTTKITSRQGGTGEGSYTDGQLLIGSTLSGALVKSTLTAGSGVSIINSSGSVTISSSGGSGLAWAEITGTSQALAVNTGYILNNAGLVTGTLPVSGTIGDIIRIVGKGSGGWRIAQNSGQVIHFGNQNTTTGAGGRLDSGNSRDSLELVCITTNTDWQVISVVGNISIT